MTDGAIDADWDDAERTYDELVADALDGIETEPISGGVAIDLVTRQTLFVRGVAADSLAEYYEAEGFDLATYKQHVWLPVRADDTVYECVFVGGLDDLHTAGKTYDYPRGRLARVPVELAWRDAEVGDV